MCHKTITLTSVSYNVAGGGNVIDVTDDVKAPVSMPESTRPASVQMIAITRPKNVLGVMSPYLQRYSVDMGFKSEDDRTFSKNPRGVEWGTHILDLMGCYAQKSIIS